MEYYSGRIIEIQLDSYKKSIYRIEIEKAISHQPGQYFNAYLPDDNTHHIPLTLFPAEFIPSNTKTNLISCFVYEDVNWHPGTEIQIRGPLGKAWQIPPSTSRIIFLNLTSHFGYLKPFIEWLGRNGKETSLLTENNTGGLPTGVEVLPLADFPEMLGWEDQILIDIERINLPKLESLAGVPLNMLPANTAVLVLDHFPCGGKADCGICAISPKRKILYPCKDGPIFNLKDVTGR